MGLLPSSLARLIASVTNGSPFEVAHAFCRVKKRTMPFSLEQIFSTQIAAQLNSRLKNTFIVNSCLDMHALQDKP